jgi:hypothetical protein
MVNQFALFSGLISTENGEPVETVVVGETAHYVVPDAGFMRHIDSKVIDLQVLQFLHDQLEPHRDRAVEEALKMIGRDDLFTKAMIDASLNNMEQLLERGIPEEMRAWLGMMGFRVIVNYRGDVVRVEQPGQIDPDE